VQRSGQRYVSLLVIVMTATVLLQRVSAGKVTSWSPNGVSSLLPLQITGTGFNATASNNVVSFLQSGVVKATVRGKSVVEKPNGVRTITVDVPPGIPIGTTALRVVNETTREISEGGPIEIIAISLPEITSAPRGSQVSVRIQGSPNVRFGAGATTVSFGQGITTKTVVVESRTSLVATIAIDANATAGLRSASTTTVGQIVGQTAIAVDAFTVTAGGNSAPVANPGGPYTGTASQAVQFDGSGSSDPDGDTLTFAWDFGDGQQGSGPTPTHAYAQPGQFTVSLAVSDGRGGSNTANTTAQITSPPPTLTGITVAPSSVRFSAVGSTRALTVTGQLSDQTTTDLTSAASGTTYESSNPYVAKVSIDGVITAFGNGEATITARNAALTAIVGVVVETGVTLTSLDLVPSSGTLHSVGAVLALALNGHFSDQTVRDLTTATGTLFRSTDDRIARVDAQGQVTAVSAGQATIEATYDVFTATASITVAVSSGNGFLTGEVYDDSRSQPLAAATVTLIADGGGVLEAPVQTVADERGRFQVSGRAGDAIVRIAKAGFTSVDRRATIPINRSATLLDARLTPLDGRLSPIVSCSAAKRMTRRIPSPCNCRPAHSRPTRRWSSHRSRARLVWSTSTRMVTGRGG
jgi:hypothetical protein